MKTLQTKELELLKGGSYFSKVFYKIYRIIKIRILMEIVFID